MDIPFDQILSCVQSSINPWSAFDKLRQVAKTNIPTVAWDDIQSPDIVTDIEGVRLWLDSEIDNYQPTGVYLGLDTLNENCGLGKNVEIGMTTAANPFPLAMEWAYRCERYGEHHLINGLYEIHQAYNAFGLTECEALLADYVYFLGYSGIVLASAIERRTTSQNCMFVWGFHDGDLGFLVRSSPSGVERLATFEGS